MKIADIIALVLAVFTCVAFGWMFIIVIRRALKHKIEHKEPHPRRFVSKMTS